jgi:hypothetical protein
MRYHGDHWRWPRKNVLISTSNVAATLLLFRECGRPSCNAMSAPPPSQPFARSLTAQPCNGRPVRPKAPHVQKVGRYSSVSSDASFQWPGSAYRLMTSYRRQMSWVGLLRSLYINDPSPPSLIAYSTADSFSINSNCKLLQLSDHIHIELSQNEQYARASHRAEMRMRRCLHLCLQQDGVWLR